MKKTNFSIVGFLIFNLSNIVAQVDSLNVDKHLKHDFHNQGAQENYWATELFKDKYDKQTYDLFIGQYTQIDKNTFKFDEKIIEVYNTSKEIKYIFKKCIFYPNVITGNRVAEIKTKKEFDSMTENQKLFYNLTRIDSLRITDFEELKFLSDSPTYKRFRFALWNKGDSKPTACFIELTNMNATEKMTFNDFIENAVLTYYIRAWRI